MVLGLSPPCNVENMFNSWYLVREKKVYLFINRCSSDLLVYLTNEEQNYFLTNVDVKLSRTSYA
jgi:hypothetical protein